MPLRNVDVAEIAAAEAQLGPSRQNDPFNHSYREFLSFFAGKTVLSAHDVTVGAYMVYGWMPTMLRKFDCSDLPRVVAVVNRTKNGAFPTQGDMTVLRGAINNSIVGPSKLLHFVNPRICAIWDSRVFRFIQGRDWRDSEMRDEGAYFEYHQILQRIVEERAFHRVHQSVNRRIGYPVTPYRACEYVMHETAVH